MMENLSESSLSYQHNVPYIHSAPTLNELSSPPKKYNCSICSTSFQRREHFERHIRGHSKSKDFICEFCDKSFARRDTLQRHSALHGKVLRKVQRTLPRASRACLNCVKSKQRCSGSHPCDRCNRKDWPCQFTKGSKEVTPQEQETFPNATERRTSNQTNQNLEQNHPPEPSLACGLSPISAIHSYPSGSDSVNLIGEPCADIPFSGQARDISQYNEATSVFESFLLWPLDDAFPHFDMASSDPSGLQTSSGVAGTVNQPKNIALGGDFPVELSNLQQNHSRHAEEAPKSSNGQSDNYVSETALTEEDRDILISEDYGHVPRPSISTYETIRAHYAEVSRFSPEVLRRSLYSSDILHVCTQLYFENFHQGFPILHQSTFEARGSSWLLYIAVAAVGSQYSRLSGRTRIFFDLMKTVRIALLRMLSSTLSLQRNLELSQATLLFNFALLFGGTREGLMHLQYQRNLLVTMCRPLLVPGALFAKCGLLANASVPTRDWTRWIMMESWKRLVYFTWLNECFQLILFDLPTLITVDDMHLSMPCHDELWQSSSFHDWEGAKGLQRVESISVTSLLKLKVIDQEHIRSLSNSALWISVFAVYLAKRHTTQQQSFNPYPSMQNISDRRNLASAEGIVPLEHDKDPVDTILGSLQQAITRHRPESPLLLIVTKFSLILRLLRFVQYRPLYISSGWMAQHHEVDAAAQHIAQLLKAEPRQARQSLMHAAQLFRIIRSQRQFDPYDAFILLMAILYIWNYDRFVMSDKLQFPSGRDAEEILRIDQNMNEDLQEKWIAGTFEMPKQLHISGIGVLNGQDSVPRIFRESMRILGHEKAWSRQANAIKHGLHQILLGGTPSFPAEVE
ncbi:hypothetical protein PENVUL_c011G10301 [Penicillium vulpinum]|uniref:C2H2-type domain-containing protein n=1 Tax=Penicillium vulpinum TaxID=29845 RepID=A0A1V6S2I4_9EURO|nr:hypothetical protein PENVUL_c011G10301 [Penicillium vulpinum]